MSRRSWAILVVIGWFLSSSGVVFAIHLANCDGDHQADQCQTCRAIQTGRATTLDLDSASPPPVLETGGEVRPHATAGDVPPAPHLGSIALRAPPIY